MKWIWERRILQNDVFYNYQGIRSAGHVDKMWYLWNSSWKLRKIGNISASRLVFNFKFSCIFLHTHIFADSNIRIIFVEYAVVSTAQIRYYFRCVRVYFHVPSFKTPVIIVSLFVLPPDWLLFVDLHYLLS